MIDSNIQNGQDLTKNFIERYKLPFFGTQPEYNLKSDKIAGKQPSYIDDDGNAQSIIWKEHQQFYAYPPGKQNRLNTVWQKHPDSGASTLLGYNGQIYIHGLDIDKKNYGDRFDRFSAALFDAYPIFDKCHRFSTPRGGLRILFATNEPLEGFGANNSFTIDLDGHLGKCGELLTNNGGHTLLPGAKGYRWQHCPKDLVFIDQPEKILKKFKTTSWDKYVSDFTWRDTEPYPLKLALSKENQELIATGVIDGNRNSAAIKITLDAVGCFEYLAGTGQKILGEPRELLEEFSNKCEPPLDDNAINSTYQSAIRHDGDKDYKSMRSPDVIDYWGARYFYELDGNGKPPEQEKKEKVVSINQKSEDPELPTLEEAVEELRKQGLTDSPLAFSLARIANQYGCNLYSVEKLYTGYLEDHELNNDLDAVKKQVQEHVANADKDVDLSAYLSPDLAIAMTRQAKMLGTSNLIMLTNLITTFSSLIPVNSVIELNDQSGHTVGANLFTCIVGDPGSGKSPAINYVMAPLRVLKREEKNRYRKKLGDYNQELELWKLDKKNHEKPAEPARWREYLTKDYTMEGIEKALTGKNTNGFLLDIDELQFMFGGFGKYNNKASSERAKWLSLRNGSPIDTLRATVDGREAEKTSISVLGGTQPGVLEQHLNADEVHDGFWARFIFCDNPTKPKIRKLSGKHIDGKAILLAAYRAVEYQHLNNYGNHITYKLSPDADAVFDRWWHHADNERLGNNNKRLGAYYAKSPEVIGQLTLILHCLEGALTDSEPELLISENTVSKAIDLFKNFYIKTVADKFDFSRQNKLAKIYQNTIDKSILFKKKDEKFDNEKDKTHGWLKHRDVKNGIYQYKNKTPNDTAKVFKELVKMGYGEYDDTGRSPRWRYTDPKSDLKVTKNDPKNDLKNELPAPSETSLVKGLQDSIKINQRKAVTLVKNEGEKPKLEVDLDKLDLGRSPQLDLEPWQPTKDLAEYTDTPKIYLDIETVAKDGLKNIKDGLKPQNGRVIAVGILYDCSGKQDYTIFSDADERIMLMDLANYLKNSDSAIISGHNIHNFDIPYLAYRFDYHGIEHDFEHERLDDHTRRSQRITAASVNGKPLEIDCWVSAKFDLIDTYILAAIYDKAAAVLPNLRLKDVAIAINIRPEKRLELDYKEIKQHWLDGNHQPIIDYLKFDLDDTKGLTDYFLPVIWYQQLLVPYTSLQYMSLISTAMKWDRMAKSFYPQDYIKSINADIKVNYGGGEAGAKHVKKGLFKDAYKIDVSSMYPSIMMQYELTSKKDKDYQLLRVLKYLFAERFRLKKLFKETGDPRYDQQQGSLKILLNSFYGSKGTGGYKFNDMAIAALVTAYGRKILGVMKAVIEEHQGTIIEIDTDGIICQGGDCNPSDMCDLVRAAMPDNIGLDLDYAGVDIYMHAAKNYLIFSGDKIKKIGIFRKRNLIKLKSDFSVEFIRQYRDNPDAAIDYYQCLRDSIEDRSIDINMLTSTLTIPKSDKRLTAAGIGQKGEKVTFYEGELKKYHKKTGKPTKSEKTPITSGDYWVDYYVDILDKEYKKVMDNLD